MDEINYQLSLILLDLLKSNNLLSDQEAASMNLQLQDYYDPVVTRLTGLNSPSE